MNVHCGHQGLIAIGMEMVSRVSDQIWSDFRLESYDPCKIRVHLIRMNFIIKICPCKLFGEI